MSGITQKNQREGILGHLDKMKLSEYRVLSVSQRYSLMAAAFAAKNRTERSEDFARKAVRQMVRKKNYGQARQLVENYGLEDQKSLLTDYYLRVLGSSQADLAKRLDAISALQAIGGRKAADALVKALEYNASSGSVWKIRAGAACALGALKDKKSVGSLILALDDKVHEVRAAAARALGKIGDSRAVGPLLEKVGKPDYIILEALEQALSKLEENEELPLRLRNKIRASC